MPGLRTKLRNHSLWALEPLTSALGLFPIATECVPLGPEAEKPRCSLGDCLCCGIRQDNHALPSGMDSALASIPAGRRLAQHSQATFSTFPRWRVGVLMGESRQMGGAMEKPQSSC